MVLLPLQLSIFLLSAGESPAPATPTQPSESASETEETSWKPTWDVGLSANEAHPLGVERAKQVIKRFMPRFPGARLISPPAASLKDFRTSVRTAKVRYALFMDRSEPERLLIIVLDEETLAVVARVNLECEDCDEKGWAQRLADGLQALADAVVPKSNEEEEEAEEKAQGAIALVFQQLGSGLKIPGVQVSLRPKGDDDDEAETVCLDSSDAKGRVRCTNLKPGTYLLKASLTGYRTLTRSFPLTEGEQVSQRLDLEPTRFDPFQVTVRRKRAAREVTRVRLSREELENIPGTGGDVVRAVQSLPGVARPPGLSPLIIIRGSEPDDSLFMIDGFRTGLLYHLTGQGVLANETVETLDFVPSNFSARYGRSHGGVVEITTREEHKENWQRRIQTDVYAGSVFGSGPVGDKGMLWLGFRRSWIDAVLPLVADVLPLEFTVAPRFYDYFAKYDRKIPGFGNAGFVYQGALDRVKFAIDQPPDFDPSVRGDVSTLTMFHRIRPYVAFKTGGWRHRSSVNAQLEAFNVNLADVFKLTVENRALVWRHESNLKLSQGLTLRLGLDSLYNQYTVNGKASGRPQEGSQPPSFARAETQEFEENGENTRPGLYSEFDITRGPWQFLIGLRADTDDANWPAYVQPRLLVRHTLPDPRWELRAGYGAYSQPPRPDETIPPFGNKGLFWEHAAHGQAGFGFDDPSGFTWETSIFAKRVLDAVGNDQDLSEVQGTANATQLANVGKGRTYGMELLLRKRRSVTPFDGFIAYTLTRAERQDRSGSIWRLFSFDQTHVATVVGTYRWTYRFSTGFRFRYATANPETPYLGSLFDSNSGTYIGIPGEPNSSRPPPFWQVDVRADYKILRPGWRVELYLDLQNATNRQNIEGTSNNTDFTEQEFTYGLPLIPSFGIKAVF